MWYKEAKPSDSYLKKKKKKKKKKKNIQVKTTNATSDIDSLNSLYFSFKGR